ncbi:MAG: undecaprenyl/decaprenyl-phosphate alpha-N-acetylglucosaminyl 1-phosphate transferase [Syntrophales bacterium LBB04]|nr:undecaprenyl/decaprenyl-phosphate alpha-N-acetylglucosaminyl 1-phosphate transferase [Syntrophales bacterium LBB04]
MFHDLHRQMMLFFVMSFGITLALMPVTIHLACKWRCIDEPGGRRVHQEPTPRWGGLPIFLGILPVIYFVGLNKPLFSYLVASFFLVIVGSVDDRRELGFTAKVFAIMAAITTVIFGGGITVQQIGIYGSMGFVRTGIVAIPFTFICIIGVTNAINLIDGLNGLAGGLSFLASLFIGVAAYLSRNFELAGVCMGFTGALAGFLLYNFGAEAAIFMGDSGSLFLGFSLSVFSILLTQDVKFHVEPLFPVLVLLIPIFDTLRVMGTRLFNGRSPFKADTIHLHHLLLAKGLSVTGIVTLLWSLTLILGVTAVSLIQRTSVPYLFIVLGVSLLFSILANSLVKDRSEVRPVPGREPMARPIVTTAQVQRPKLVRKSANDW